MPVEQSVRSEGVTTGGHHGWLYFHAPCFDGIASAVLAWAFLEARAGWSSCELVPLNYSVRNQWSSRQLEHPSAVVDFLFHPQADFWADHHGSTFLTPDAEDCYARTRDESHLYDASARSCAGLIYRRLGHVLGAEKDYSDLVAWAEKIDSADYASIEEALFSTAPALQINAGLSLERGSQFSLAMIRELRHSTLEQVAQMPEVQARAERAHRALRRGLGLFEPSARLLDERIVVFDIKVERTKEALVSRYAPYYFYPDAHYSAGVMRSEAGAWILVMRNPWKEFKSAPIGTILTRYGGGGHDRVGAIQLDTAREHEATAVLQKILIDIQNHERAHPGRPQP